MWCDAHIHLDDVAGDPLAAGLGATTGYRALIPAGEPADTLAALQRWKGDARLAYATGIHPWYLPDDAAVHPEDDPRWDVFTSVVSNGNVIGIGETGLDRLRHTTPEVAAQAERYFAAQVRVAAEHGRFVVIHCVRAHARAAEVVRAEGRGRVTGMVHAFAGSFEEARAWQRLGFYVSFGPAVTRPASNRVRDVVTRVPLGQLLIETDAPYMAAYPDAPGGGTPDDLLRVAAEVAALRGVALDEIEAATARNYARLLAGQAP